MMDIGISLLGKKSKTDAYFTTTYKKKQLKTKIKVFEEGKKSIDINEEIKTDKHFYLDRNSLNNNKIEIEKKFENYNKESSDKKKLINNEFLNIYKNKTDETKKTYKKIKKTIEIGGF